MGSYITVDSWLVSLAARGKEEATVARILAVAQHNLSRDLGHVLALNDEFVRRRITERAHTGALPKISVRCIRCLATARIEDWVKIAGMTGQQRFLWYEHIQTRHGAELAEFIKNCRGEFHAARTLDAIDHMEWERRP